MFILDLTQIPAIDYAIALAVYLWVFWGLYVLVMGVYRAFLNKKLNPLTMGMGAPYVVVGGIVDVFANFFIATFIFLEIPKEFLVTSRLKRYNNNENTAKWRKSIASYVCTNLLDVFDPSEDHC